MTDIVERIRAHIEDPDYATRAEVRLTTLQEAADEIEQLRAALAAQPADPVAWINRRVIYDPATDSVTGYGESELLFERVSYGYDYANAKPLVLAQPAPAAVPLTDEQIRDLAKESGLDWHRGYMPLFANDPTNRYEVFARAVLAAAGDKP